MSDSEEENFCFFGKPLDPYDEDTFPKKKPIPLEDQVAKDAQGRRRFHGAFTGGFSAGFFNTVGSLEGWAPTEFKSTRQEKAQSKAQRPEDFMDDEDVGQFGIAPQTVKATKDYATGKKRKRQVFSDGPIPGEPVLHSLLTSGNETIGYLLLKNIGLKHRNKTQEVEGSDSRVYGCEMPKTYEISRHDDINQYVIPEIYKEFLKKPKINTFGIGYVGLDKTHVNLFQSSNLVVNERNKKKLSIAGQAFGVGAFEDDDEDIYVKDDMSKYDFELTAENVAKKSLMKSKDVVLDDFVQTKNILAFKETFLPPTIPHSFTGKHKVKKSRFEPLPSVPEPTTSRKDMNAETRRSLLEDPISKTVDNSNVSSQGSLVQKTVKEEPLEHEVTTNKSASSAFDLTFDRFVAASQPEDASNILEAVKPTESTHGTEEMKAAVRMKMFGPLTRVSCSWQPCSILCRRFNVPEPNFDGADTSRNKKRTKNLIFEYQKHTEDYCDSLKPGLTIQTTTEEITPVSDAEPGVAPVESGLEIPQETSAPVSEDKPNSIEETEPLPKDITERIGIDQNVDLFKSVFLSSSESEDEEDAKEETKNEEMKANLLSEHLLPKIKPIKEGILSNVNFSIFNSSEPVESVSTSNSVPEKSVEEDVDWYGPKLPSNLTGTRSTNLSSVKEEDGDEWIEKEDLSEDSSRQHKRKHKNKKHGHKKKHKKKR